LRLSIKTLALEIQRAADRRLGIHLSRGFRREKQNAKDAPAMKGLLGIA
jgi:hypothetical protein